MDWLAFFQDHHIEYVERGSNVKKGNVNIHCVWCGENDPSHHLGVSLTGRGFGCWRNATHSGKAPVKLVQALLGVSKGQAALTVAQYSASDPETLDDALDLLTGHDKPEKRHNKPLHLPEEFRPIKNHGSTARFWHYLEARGFEDVDILTRTYSLKCCTTGIWKDRIIIPLWHEDKLVNWTGRALQKPIDAPRYKTLSLEEGALENVKDMVFDEDGLLEGGKVLFIVEGPFDAIKLDFYGFRFDARATCVFGTAMIMEQAAIIGSLSKRFNRTILLFDPGATEAIFMAADKLEPFGIEIGSIPEGLIDAAGNEVDDPGAMTRKQVHDFVKGFL